MDERQLRAEVVEHLRHGRKIVAVKRVREVSGWSLARSKDFVEDVEANGERAVMPGPLPDATPTEASPGLDPSAIEAMVRNGRMIDAIKAYRVATGLGLAESKAAVEAIRDRLAASSRPASPFGATVPSATPNVPSRPRFADDASSSGSGISLGLFLFALAGVLVTGGALAYLLLGR